MCPQGLTFFGLTSNTAPQFRKNLFSHIHQIIFHSKGGYDFGTIYNLPIWLRKFIFNEINNYYKEEAKAIEKAKDGKGKQTLVNPDGKVNTPEFAKASQQYKKADQNLKKFRGKSNFKQ